MSPGHLLLIPFRHVASFFEATEAEQAALLSLVHDARRLLDERYAPDGYNIGVNIGAAASISLKRSGIMSGFPARDHVQFTMPAISPCICELRLSIPQFIISSLQTGK